MPGFAGGAVPEQLELGTSALRCDEGGADEFSYRWVARSPDVQAVDRLKLGVSTFSCLMYALGELGDEI